MTEPLILVLLIGIPLLYSLGGMIWKGFRRYGIPLLIAGVMIVSGNVAWKTVLAVVLTCGALHLGYGESSNWLKKILYAVAISIPTFLVAFNFWAFVLPVVFIGTFILSNTPKWQNIFNWRICEAMVGFALGIVWSQILM